MPPRPGVIRVYSNQHTGDGDCRADQLIDAGRVVTLILGLLCLLAPTVSATEPTRGERTRSSSDVFGVVEPGAASESPFLANEPALCVCADLDGDGEATLDDFITFTHCFGSDAPTAGCTAEELACSDLDGDQVVDLADFLIFAACYEDPTSCSQNNPPVADAGPDQNGEVGQLVTFDAAASFDPNGTIEFYAWDFGDGQTASGQVVSHAYSDPGTYAVTLTVSDNCAVTGSDSAVATITQVASCDNNTAPTADAGPDQAADVGAPVTFDGSGSSDPDGQVVEYWWNFGDGQYTGWQSEAVVQHAYTEAGTYTVQLWAKDDCGDFSAADTAIATVGQGDPCANNQAPVADAGGDQTAEAGQQVTFDAGASFDPDGSIQSYDWDFGDGQSASGQTVTHVYANPGTYTVTLTVTDYCGADDSDTSVATITEASGGTFDPRLIGFVPGLGTASGVALSPDGTTAYVASAEMGLVIVDLTDPADPRLLSSQDVPSPAEYAAISGTIAVTASTGAAAQVVDISDPLAPHVVASLPFGGQGLAMHGTYVYVATGPGGLRAIDLADPANPVSCETVPIFARDVVISSDGRWGYVAAGPNGLAVLDLSNPGSPALTATLDTPGNASGVALDESNALACIADGVAGLQVVDVSVPENPQLILSAPTDSLWAGQVAILGAHAVVTAPRSIFVFDLSDPSSPQVISTGNESPQDIASVGALVVTVEGPNGVSCRQLVGSTLAPVGQLPSSIGTRSDVAVDGPLCLVTSSDNWTQVVDLSDPSAPQAVAQITAGWGWGAALRGAVGYVAAGSGGLQAVDLRDPAHPQISTTLPMNALDVVLSQDGVWGFVASGTSGLTVINLSDPLGPVVQATVDTPGFARSLSFDGNSGFLYLADGSGDLQVADVSLPEDPAFMDPVPIPGSAMHVTVDEGYAFVSTSSSVQIVDVRDPQTPQLLDSFASNVGALAVRDALVYLPRGAQGVAVYDSSNPQDVLWLEDLPTLPGNVGGVAVIGDRAYVGHSAATVLVYDLFSGP